MRPFMHIMLKPASGLCNLRCKYCFYADETQKREIADYGMMSYATLSSIIIKTLAETSKQATIAFQGGEPMLAGIDFFKRVIQLVEQNNINHCKVGYALQTNGTLLNDEWCQFFAKNNFLIGVSLDGTREIHDRNRIDHQGKGTYNKVMQGIQLLKKHKVEFNILTVLTSEVCRHFNQIYKFYDKQEFFFQQYIPCLDPLGEERGQYPWSLTPRLFEQYLKTSFDCWYRDAMSGHKKYHRYFDNLLIMLNRQPPEACGMGGNCGIQYVVEADGSVYPCDFYMLDDKKLGNLNFDDFSSLDQKRTELQFIEQSEVTAKECFECKWWALCRGGCRRDRDFFQDGLQKNYYCTAYKNFFEYSFDRLVQVYQIMVNSLNT